MKEMDFKTLYKKMKVRMKEYLKKYHDTSGIGIQQVLKMKYKNKVESYLYLILKTLIVNQVLFTMI